MHILMKSTRITILMEPERKAALLRHLAQRTAKSGTRYTLSDFVREHLDRAVKAQAKGDA